MKNLLEVLTMMTVVMVSISLASCGGDDNGGGSGVNNGGGSTTEQVFTGTTSNVTASSATVSCNYSSTANASTLQLGILYSTERSTVDNRQGTLAQANTVAESTYTVELSSLLSNTIYYYRAYMVSDGKTYYGSVNSFTTSQDELVTTGEATGITFKSAVISSRFKSNIIQSFTALGIEYSASKDVFESGRGSWETTSSVTNGNVFTVTLDGLSEQTTYYYRAFVKTSQTTYYGVAKSFTTARHTFNSNGHDYVNLGLPSGTMWATMNVGASKPEDIGDYYAWGETTTKTSFTTNNYQWQGLSTEELISRGVVSVEEISVGYSNYLLTASYDAATVKWGGNWRMPTQSEITELEQYTTITTSTQNGVDGFLLTSTKNKNSIFLPSSGFWNENGVQNGRTSGSDPWYRVTCWSSQLNDYHDDWSIAIWIDNGSSLGMKYIGYTGANRYYGSPIRPIIQ